MIVREANEWLLVIFVFAQAKLVLTFKVKMGDQCLSHTKIGFAQLILEFHDFKIMKFFI